MKTMTIALSFAAFIAAGAVQAGVSPETASADEPVVNAGPCNPQVRTCR